MNYLRHVLDHLHKDLRLEWRSRDSINGMLFFSLLVVVVFSLAFDPTTAMSRQIAGVRGRSLIVNLPGKPSAIRDCLLAVFPAIPYCVDLIEGPFLTTNEAVVKAFRPRQ